VARRFVTWYRLEPPSLPIRHWLPGYERRWMRPDVIAAAAVWAVLVPEGMFTVSVGVAPDELVRIVPPVPARVPTVRL